MVEIILIIAILAVVLISFSFVTYRHYSSKNQDLSSLGAKGKSQNDQIEKWKQELPSKDREGSDEKSSLEFKSVDDVSREDKKESQDKSEQKGSESRLDSEIKSADTPIKVEELLETPVQVVPALSDRLSKSRGLFANYLPKMLGRVAIPSETWDELEEALILADVGITCANEILGALRTTIKEKKISEPKLLIEALSVELEKRLETGNSKVLEYSTNEGPTVWLVVGVNGVGKTTTIGKLASKEIKDGKKVLLAAGDTFRAAASEQLEMWAKRSGADFLSGGEGADPASVIFDAVSKANSKGHDLVIADSAGRLHTKINLMEELKKVAKVASREPGNLTEILLVLDATTGQNGLIQASEFKEASNLTGVVLTKLDGTAKGGIAIAITQALGLPVKLVGVGEGVDDLMTFDPHLFVSAILS